MRYSVIDIGSNSIRLLIAEITGKTKLLPLVNRVNASRLIGQSTDKVFIKKPDLNKTIDIIKRYKRIIKKYKVDKSIFFGTYSLRKASNSEDIKKRLEKTVNAKITILSGDKESGLSARSIVFYNKKHLKPGQKIITIDIGGGSTEINLIRILGDGYKIEYKKSFEIGAVSLKNMFIQNYPVKTRAAGKINTFLLRFFKKLDLTADIAVGVGGTITTLGAIDLCMAKYDPDLIERHLLYSDKLDKLSNIMQLMTVNEIKMLPGVTENRKDIIYPGMQICRVIIKKIHKKSIYISDKGPLYGALLSDISGKN